MACFLHIAYSNDPQFRVAHRSGVIFSESRNYDEVYQVVVTKSSGFHDIHIKELHVTPLTGQLGVRKMIHTLSQRVWWPKLHDKVASVIYSCTT